MTTTPETISIDGASCTIFRDAPTWNGYRTAAIGKFSASSLEAGKLILSKVCDSLVSERFEAVIGPMDGDTWHKYRVVSRSDGSPPFLMEPVSGPHDSAAFTAEGFEQLSRYVSARAAIDDAIGPNDPVRVDDVSVTPWNGENAEHLIGRLFDMSAMSFSANAFFKSISKDEFLDLYRPVMSAIDPRLVLFAYSNGELVGFLFGIPNHLEGPSPTHAILKTYASARRGVGHLLADSFHRTVRELGYSHVIHALMHADNVSLDRSKQHVGTVFREYALLGKRLRA